MTHFWKELRNNLELKRFNWNNIFTVDTEFTITKEGRLEEPLLTKPTGLAEFDRMVIYGLKRMKKKWESAKVNGLPVNYRVKFTFSGVTDIVD
ncbi:energy transducer TonB [Epilithonimonas pallida]|uniref:TonB protein C-terminal n=1 Tax=Epilithonimonas pallida TaxID=373671 RepID=A0ABY1QZZ7_9FLAO|nr:hypothetical protein [Epilithonimonas pallida]SMP91002.1 TonB protein C-terminal [Epilithonimonas pallida]